MKVGPPIDPKAAQVQEGDAARAHRTGGAAASAGPAAPVDQVVLSHAATQLGAGGSADFDVKKVAQIQEAIRQGRFQVNAGAVADRLIADAAALLAPRGAAQ